MSRVGIGDLAGLHRMENERGWRRGIGNTLIVRWKGPEISCAQYQDTLTQSGDARIQDAQISHDSGGMYILTVTYAVKNATDDETTPLSGPDSVVTTWTREGGFSDKSLWNLGPIRDALAPLTEDQRADFRAVFTNWVTGAITVGEWSKWYTENYKSKPGVTAQNIADIQQMISAWAAGTEAYQLEFFTFVRTQVGPLDQLVNSDATINTVFKRATLVADTTMPNAFKALVPAGYFKQGVPVVTQIDGSRWQMVTTWDHTDAYNEWLWGASI